MNVLYPGDWTPQRAAVHRAQTGHYPAERGCIWLGACGIEEASLLRVARAADRLAHVYLAQRQDEALELIDLVEETRELLAALDAAGELVCPAKWHLKEGLR